MPAFRRLASVVVPGTTAFAPADVVNRAPRGRNVQFTKDAVEDPDELTRLLQQFSRQVEEEGAALRGHPLLRGNLLRNQALPGWRAQVDAGTGTPTITLWRPKDAALFTAGEVIVACTSDGVTRGSQRAGSVTLASVDYVNGTLTATGNWTAGIAAIAAGDYLFKSGEFQNANVRLEHRLGKTPTWWWVARVAKGSVCPTLALLSADDKALYLYSTRAAVADVFVVAE